MKDFLFSCNNLFKNPGNVSVSIGPFCSQLGAQYICSTMMVWAIWVRDLWMVSFVYEKISLQQFLPYSSWKTTPPPPRHLMHFSIYLYSYSIWSVNFTHDGTYSCQATDRFQQTSSRASTTITVTGGMYMMRSLQNILFLSRKHSLSTACWQNSFCSRCLVTL